MREAENFGGEIVALAEASPRLAGSLALRQCRLLQTWHWTWTSKTPGRPYPSCGRVVWEREAEPLAILAEVMAIAVSSRLAGLLMHRALRPLINLAKRLSASRGPVALGQSSTLMALATLCFFATALPEVLDPPEPPPHATRGLPACKRALSVDHCWCQTP